MQNIIFGATSGLGWNITSALLSEGMSVAAFGRREARLNALRALNCVTSEDNAHLLTHTGNVTKEDDVIAFLDAVQRRGQAIQRVFYCCGSYREAVPTAKTELWKEVLAVNFFGALHALEMLTQLPSEMLCPPLSFIVLTSSLARGVLPGSGAYSCSKSALERMVASCGVDLSPDQWRVYAIDPGAFRSEMNTGANVSAEDVARSLLTFMEGENSDWHGKVLELPQTLTVNYSQLLPSQIDAPCHSSNVQVDSPRLAIRSV